MINLWFLFKIPIFLAFNLFDKIVSKTQIAKFTKIVVNFKLVLYYQILSIFQLIKYIICLKAVNIITVIIWLVICYYKMIILKNLKYYKFVNNFKIIG